MAVSEAAPKHLRLSELLHDLADKAGERISLGALADAIGERSFAALMIIFAAPNLIPMPPGASTVFGVPLLLVAVQLLLGEAAWALYCAPVALVAAALVYGASYVGQGLATAQMYELREFLEETVEGLVAGQPLPGTATGGVGRSPNA